MFGLLRTFIQDELGATAMEYALLASLIAVAIISGAQTLGSRVSGSLGNTAASMK
jgi:pilus assembly protein Flp/PilA